MTRRFRLATAERLRRASLDEAARRLGEARRALATAQARQDELAALLAGCVVPPRSTPDGARAVAERRAHLREQLLAGADQVRQAQADVGVAVASWQAARADLRSVEALHDRHRLALAAEDARRAQHEADELALGAFGRGPGDAA